MDKIYSSIINMQDIKDELEPGEPATKVLNLQKM